MFFKFGLLLSLSTQLLHGFKVEVGEASWNEFADQFPPALKEKLSSTYQL